MPRVNRGTRPGSGRALQTPRAPSMVYYTILVTRRGPPGAIRARIVPRYTIRDARDLVTPFGRRCATPPGRSRTLACGGTPLGLFIPSVFSSFSSASCQTDALSVRPQLIFPLAAVAQIPTSGGVNWPATACARTPIRRACTIRCWPPLLLFTTPL